MSFPSGASDEFIRKKQARQQQEEDARGMIKDDARAAQAAARQPPVGMSHGQSGAYHAAVGGQAQGNHLGGMISQVMGEWGQEHANRTLQAREAQQRQHEANLQAMQSQQEMAKQNQANEMLQQAQQAKREKNAMLMSLAGMGGHSITAGPGGFKIFRNGLLG